LSVIIADLFKGFIRAEVGTPGKVVRTWLQTGLHSGLILKKKRKPHLPYKGS